MSTIGMNCKLEYLNSNTFETILQQVCWCFPASLQRRKYFLLWSFNTKKQNVVPFSLNWKINSSKIANSFILTNSMAANLISLNSLKKLYPNKEFQTLISGGLYGLSLNLKNATDLIVVDIDSFDPTTLNSPPNLTPETLNQRLVIESLKDIPHYAEISASGNGIHIFFSFRQFERFLDNRFISNPAAKIEIFIGGGNKNKMVILTGNQISLGGADQDFEILQGRKTRTNYRVVKPSLTQLSSFIQLLEKFKKIKTSNNILVSPETKLPKWLSSFSNFKNSIAKESNSPQLNLEQQEGYSLFLTKIAKLKILTFKKNYSDQTYKSQSEVDYQIFSLILTLFKFNFDQTNFASIVYTCIHFYKQNFPIRDNKHSDYLLRTCFKLFVNFYSKTEKISPSLILENNFKSLIKTPLGLLGVSLKSNEQKIFLKNRELLTDFDFDLYQNLLHLTVEQSLRSSANLGEIRSMKLSIHTSIGSLARFITRKKNVSSLFYKKIVESLGRLASTQLVWDTPLTQGSICLLEYVNHKESNILEVSFTNFLAWILAVDTETLKRLNLHYCVYYSQFFLRYETAKQRKMYRFLINNLPVMTQKKILNIDQTLLSSFYNNYNHRRHSLFKNTFLESINEFSKITDTDIRVKITGQKLVLSRVNLS